MSRSSKRSSDVSFVSLLSNNARVVRARYCDARRGVPAISPRLGGRGPADSIFPCGDRSSAAEAGHGPADAWRRPRCATAPTACAANRAVHCFQS